VGRRAVPDAVVKRKFPAVAGNRTLEPRSSSPYPSAIPTELSWLFNYLQNYSLVCIALGYGLDDPHSGIRFPAGAGIFLFITASGTAVVSTQPPIQWIPGALSLGVKRPVRQADHSPPSSAEVKNTWSYTSTPPIRLHCVVLS
jgi:hypothetical protein